MTEFAIRFDFPEADGDPPIYAGRYKDSLGYAPTLATALLWEDRAVAERVLRNGYGPNVGSCGRVVRVADEMEGLEP